MSQSSNLKNLSILWICLLLCSFNSTISQGKSPTPEYIKYYNQGIVAQNNNDYAAAIELYKDALDLKPDFSDALNNLGYCYRMTAKSYLSQAGDAYAKALQHDPEHERALEYQGEYFIMMGDLKKSYGNYQLLQKLKSSEAHDLKESLDPVLKQAQDILKKYSP